MEKLYLVLISKKGGYEVHSIHKDETEASAWRRCIEHEGKDTAIAEISKELLQEAKDE